jgi:hypothetical protein
VQRYLENITYFLFMFDVLQVLLKKRVGGGETKHFDAFEIAIKFRGTRGAAALPCPFWGAARRVSATPRRIIDKRTHTANNGSRLVKKWQRR